MSNDPGRAAFGYYPEPNDHPPQEPVQVWEEKPTPFQAAKDRVDQIKDTDFSELEKILSSTPIDELWYARNAVYLDMVKFQHALDANNYLDDGY